MALLIPTGPFSAFLFDLDGTLADTMPLHYRAWRETLDPLGAEFPEDYFYEIGGTPTARIVEILNERNNLNMPVALTAQQKSDAFVALLAGARPIDEVMAFARRAGDAGGKLAVVTGGVRWVTDRILKVIGAHDLFLTIITADDVARGKPAPDGYLEAARRLAVGPDRCLVFEDTRTGIEAATAAGMQSVLVPRQR